MEERVFLVTLKLSGRTDKTEEEIRRHFEEVIAATRPGPDEGDPVVGQDAEIVLMAVKRVI